MKKSVGLGDIDRLRKITSLIINPITAMARRDVILLLPQISPYLTVLHAEDDPKIRAMLYRNLRKLDFIDITLTENGALALESFRRDRQSIVVSDFDMPVMDGVTFLHHVLELDPRKVVMVFSNYLVQDFLHQLHERDPRFTFSPKLESDCMIKKSESDIYFWVKFCQLCGYALLREIEDFLSKSARSEGKILSGV